VFRYAAAIKEQSKASGSNQQSSTAKVDNLREEFDDACYKVDQCRVSIRQTFSYNLGWFLDIRGKNNLQCRQKYLPGILLQL